MNNSITLRDFQELIRTMYYEKDAQRGATATFLWLSEEIGELAASIRSGDVANQQEEFADVLAWLTTIANILNIDLTEAVRKKYGSGCPGCGRFICACSDGEKP